MPRDEWARANSRAKYGPFGGEKRQRARDEGRRRAQAAIKREAIKRRSKPNTFHFSVESKLWFGKHKDKRIGDIPKDYLDWLVRTNEPGKFWRMDGLVAFLRQYLHAQDRQR